MTAVWERIDYLGALKPSYQSLWDLQRRRVDEVAAGQAREAVIFCEHESVFTLGKRTQRENLPSGQAIPTYQIERGGDITWHGPGQLVVYPILRLNGPILGFGLHEYLRFLEQAVIDSLNDLGIESGRFGPTGVWVNKDTGPKKIASIGVAVRRWVTYHGVSINISNAMTDFQQIRPCNFDSEIMTSVQSEGVTISLHGYADLFESKMFKLLNIPQMIIDPLGPTAALDISASF